MSDLEKAYYDAEFKARHPDFVPEAPAKPEPAETKNVSIGGGPEGTGMAVMDTLAGLLKGSVAATLGLPGDVESLVRLLTGGKQVMPTTEDMQGKLPDVVPDGGSDHRKRNAAVSEDVGEFLPLAPVAILKGAVKKTGKKGAAAAAAATPAATSATDDRVIMYDADGKRIGTLDNIKGGGKPAPAAKSKPKPANYTARG